MNSPKIRWYAQKDKYGHLITAEISLGSCIIPCWEQCRYVQPNSYDELRMYITEKELFE